MKIVVLNQVFVKNQGLFARMYVFRAYNLKIKHIYISSPKSFKVRAHCIKVLPILIYPLLNSILSIMKEDLHNLNSNLNEQVSSNEIMRFCLIEKRLPIKKQRHCFNYFYVLFFSFSTCLISEMNT